MVFLFAGNQDECTKNQESEFSGEFCIHWKCSVNKEDSAKLTLIIITLLISFHCFALTIKNKIQDIFSR